MAPDRLRVMTFNIWNRQGPWEARLEIIRQGLLAEAPDVVALQEVLRFSGHDGQRYSQGDAIAAGLGYGVAYGPAHSLDEHGLLELGNAVLSKLPLVEQHTVALPNPQRHEGRSLLYALVEGPGGQVPIFTTHLDWQFDLSHVRCRQIAFISETMATLVAGARGRGGADVLPPILLGDLNAEQDSDEIRFLRGLHALPGAAGEPLGVYFADAFGLRGQGDGATFARSNPYAAKELEPDRRIDYIFIGGIDKKLRGEPLLARRCFTAPRDGVFASDHYGVLADIQIAPRHKAQY